MLPFSSNTFAVIAFGSCIASPTSIFVFPMHFAQYHPVVHVTHAVCPCCNWYFPFGQAEHEVDLVLLEEKDELPDLLAQAVAVVLPMGALDIVQCEQPRLWKCPDDDRKLVVRHFLHGLVDPLQ